MLNSLKIALVHNTDTYLYGTRVGLIRSLVERGAKVYAIAPPGEFVSGLQQAGAEFIPWELGRRSLNPISEAGSILALLRMYRQLKPDVVHHFTVKPNIYGGIAAWMAGVPTVLASVTGLGYVFTEETTMARTLRGLVSRLYRLAFDRSSAVIFETQDDMEYLEKAGALPSGKSHYIPGGVGIDISHFTPEAVDGDALNKIRKGLGICPGSQVVVLAARMLWHKGIREYVEAARSLEKTPNLHILLAGPVDVGNPAAIPLAQLEEWSEEGLVTYLGERSDIRELLALSDIVVLPSYREGIPRILMEASAMGKPIIAANVPGCRDVVTHSINGLLVEPRDPIALASAIETLLHDEMLRERFGFQARQRALKEFDRMVVVEEHLRLYEELLSKASG